MNFLINSIYLATEGEGIHVGIPQIFVRYQGCSIGCLNCDSKDTWNFDESAQMSLQAVLKKVDELSQSAGVKRVSITGGDPLHPRFEPGLIELVKTLKKKQFFVNIEASGSRIPHQVFDQLDSIAFDVKTPSTGVTTPFANIEKLIEQYPKKYQIKSVIENRGDFDYILNIRQKFKMSLSWVLTPAYTPGDEFSLTQFAEILEWNYKSGSLFRVVGQQHKWIFGADKKQV